MAIRTSVANGAWDNVASWNTGVPVDGDTAVINHNIYIDSNVTVGTGASGESNYAITINSGGVLRWANPPSGNWCLTVKGSIRVNSGGTFRVGTQETPLTASRTADIYFPQAGNNYFWCIYAYGGVVDLHGAPAYHMGSSSMQRAKLAANISAGSVSFQLDRDVDWSVGDWIAIGCGGDKTYTPNATTHRPERVQITAKADARNYTATFSYVHRAGDHVISLIRNITVRGDGNQRGIRFVADAGDATGTAPTRLRITWTTLRYIGEYSSYSYAGIFWNVNPTSPTALHPADAFIVKNVALDTSGQEYISSPPYDYPQAYGIVINTNTGFSAEDCIQDINAYAMGVVLYMYAGWGIEVARVVGIETGVHLAYINGPGGWDVRMEDVWVCARNWQCPYSIAFNGEFSALVNVECFNVYTALINFIASGGSGGYAGRVAWCRYKNWKVYSIYSDAITTDSTTSPRYNSTFENMEFYRVRLTVFLLATGGSSVCVKNCSFDACNTDGSYTSSVFRIQELVGEVYFVGCTFGTVARNKYANIVLYPSSGLLHDHAGRVRVEKSTFIEPIDWAMFVNPYQYGNKTQTWSVRVLSWQWPSRLSQGSKLSVEWADCQVRAASGEDQWALDYPGGVRHIARVCGGGEMIDEPTVKLDGTFCRLLLPLYTLQPMWANVHNPIRVPVSTGQTVTAKLSMRKTKDGRMALPGIRLEGPGIYAAAFMTPGLLNTWEELVVSGTATADGTCYLYVSGGTNNPNDLDSTDPLRAPPPIGSSFMDMFDCRVYADGLDIVVV